MPESRRFCGNQSIEKINRTKSNAFATIRLILGLRLVRQVWRAGGREGGVWVVWSRRGVATEERKEKNV